MNGNKQFIPNFGSSKNFGSILEQTFSLKEENEKLLQENLQLKKSIQDQRLLRSEVYNQWKNLREAAERYKKSRRLLSGSAVSWTILITLSLAIFAFYNFFFNAGKNFHDLKNSKVVPKASAPAAIDSSIQNKDEAYDLKHSSSNITVSNSSFKKKPSTSLQKKLPISPDPALSVEATHSLETKKNNTVNGTSSGLYKVKSTAYFYNEPDSTTRRHAFIVHWNNNYATLKALDDKKGFIYVVFTNNIGQTSKGWLRKYDLYPVEEKSEHND